MSAAGEAFELVFPVDPSDIDELDHVNNVAYVRWMQDLAIAHWKAAAAPQDQEALLWVVLRHEIDYKQPARLGDQIRGRTWVGKAERLRFERFTEMLRVSDGVLLAKSRSLWCPLDRATGRPTAVRPEVRAAFST